jgi:protein-tyrosine-phosphatase
LTVVDRPATEKAGKDSLPKSVLFVCGMNAIRSPMAETLARAVLPNDVFIASAGVQAGTKDPFVDAVLSETGLTTGKHQPQALDELDDAYFDLIITLSPEAHHTALELTRTMPVNVEYWPTSDPSGAGDTRDQKLAAYRTVREQLKQRIAMRFNAPAQS